MKMNEKLEIMLSRKRIKKTDFAHSIGITSARLQIILTVPAIPVQRLSRKWLISYSLRRNS